MKSTQYASRTFVTVPNKCTMATLSTKAQAIFFWLVAYDFEFDTVVPSRGGLGELAGIKSKTTVTKAIQELEDAGLITMKERITKSGQSTNTYQINIVDHDPCTMKDLQGGVQNMYGGCTINEHEYNNKDEVIKDTNVSSADAGGNGELSITKMYYDIIKKYSLPNRNNYHTKKRIKEFEEANNQVGVKEYLRFMLDNDYDTLDGDYKPLLTQANDIRDKSISIVNWLSTHGFLEVSNVPSKSQIAKSNAGIKKYKPVGAK